MNKTKNTILAALLTGLSILLTFSPFKLPVPPPFSVTLGSHVPTMIALLINPWVTLFTVIGSSVGFLMATGNIVIVFRAASHILFALTGAYLLKNKRINIIWVIIITSFIHAGAEALLVYFLTPIFVAGSTAIPAVIAKTAFIGTIFHHYIDAAIATPIVYALTKANLIQTHVFKK